MSFARNLKRRVYAAVPATIFLGLTVYFGWNATRGELGLRAFARRSTDLAAAQQNLATAAAERDDWQRRVASMQPAHLDSDALDEQARQILNLSGPTDVVVPVKNSPSANKPDLALPGN